MKKMWAVSHGEYSYYTVDAVFSRKALAVLYATAKGSDYRAFQLPFYGSLPKPELSLHLRTEVYEDGTTVDTEEFEHYFAGVDDAGDRGPNCSTYTRDDASYSDTITVSSRGYDIDRVRKAHSEARAQAIANASTILGYRKAKREQDRIIREARTRQTYSWYPAGPAIVDNVGGTVIGMGMTRPWVGTAPR